jgi:hypothetical protein
MQSVNESNPSLSLPKASRPLLKWAGGKTQMIPSLLEAMPKKFENYIMILKKQFIFYFKSLLIFKITF